MVGSCFRNETVARQVSQTTLPARTVTEEGSALSRLVGQGVDAIAIKPLVTDNPELLRGLDKVRAARIPVITLDSFIDHPAVVCTVGLDNWTAQALAATFDTPGAGGWWRCVELREASAFLVVDESGEARIDPSGPFLMSLSYHRTGTSVLSRYPDMHEDLASLLSTRGVVSTT